jgi:hypothetical protein
MLNAVMLHAVMLSVEAPGQHQKSIKTPTLNKMYFLSIKLKQSFRAEDRICLCLIDHMDT